MNWSLNSHFHHVSRKQSAIGELVTIPNRKKVANKADILFLSPEATSEWRYKQGWPNSASSNIGNAL